MLLFSLCKKNLWTELKQAPGGRKSVHNLRRDKVGGRHCVFPFSFYSLLVQTDWATLHIHTVCRRQTVERHRHFTLEGKTHRERKKKKAKAQYVLCVRLDVTHCTSVSPRTRPVTLAWVSALTSRGEQGRAIVEDLHLRGNRTLNEVSGCKRRNMCALLVIPHDSKSLLRDSSHSGWGNPTPSPPEKKKSFWILTSTILPEMCRRVRVQKKMSGTFSGKQM